MTLADGRAALTGDIRFPLKPRAPREEITLSLTAELADLRSETLVPSKLLSMPRAQLAIDDNRLEISGDGRLGLAAFSGAWTQPFSPPGSGEPAPPSELLAEVEITPEALTDFNITLPPGAGRGVGTGALRLSFPRGEAPQYQFASDLRGLGLRDVTLGWGKAPGSAGQLDVAGRLGAEPSVERLTVAAPGCNAEGRIALAEGTGAVQRAQFDRILIRLHVLGDFWSVEYVDFWARMLEGR